MTTTYRSILPLVAALLCPALASTGRAGEVLASEEKLTLAPIEKNPLCFFGGKICFDFEERFRWEIRSDNFDFADSAHTVNDDNWFLQRARLGLKVNVSDWVRLYAQVQDSREINSNRADVPGLLGAEGDDAFDLRQAWVEIGNPKAFPLSLRAGRQLLSYGDEWLVGSFDWNNIGRTFDAVKLRREQQGWWAEGFASSVVVPERGSYNQSDFFNGNETDRGQIFSGLYVSSSIIPVQATDFYVFHLHENDSDRYQPNDRGDSNFFTIGTRIASKPGAFAPHTESLSKDGKAVVEASARPVGLDYNAEFAFQTGSVRGQDLTAFAAHGALGYTFDHEWLPRVAVGYSFATGDDDPRDREIQTFQNLFPTNHKFYGQMDLFAWQNLHDLEINFKVQPLRQVTVRADYHVFWLETTEDAWYRANGIVTVRPLNEAARSASNFAGSEVDFLFTWQVTKAMQLEGGYSHFFAGDYLRDTGPGDDADFGYLQAKFTF
jgi:hypothetical protein